MSSGDACRCGGESHEDGCEGASLLPSIDLPRVRCLNEQHVGSCRVVFRALAERASRAGALRSNPGDADLLLTIPFTSPVRVKSVCVAGDEALEARLFVDKEGLDFAGAAESAPAQALELPADPAAELWHTLRAARFQSVTCLTLLLRGGGTVSDDGAAVVYFVGLKGAPTGHRRGVVQAVYEARAQLADHQARADAGGGRLGL
jgi:hypothetical protein